MSVLNAIGLLVRAGTIVHGVVQELDGHYNRGKSNETRSRRPDEPHQEVRASNHLLGTSNG